MPSLGNDLALIREEQNLTLKDIQDATKIPSHILRSIEDDSIFSDFEENKTYIRSYVRSYAKALKIEDERIIKALDQQEEGSYTGTLTNEPEMDKPQGIESPKDDAKQDTTSEGAEEMVHDHSPEFSEDTKQKTSANTGKDDDIIDKSPSVRSVDWADLGRQFQPLDTQSKYWAGVLILVFAVLAGLFAFYYYQSEAPASSTNEPPQEQMATSPNLIPDSLQLDVRDTNVQENESIPDDISTSADEESQRTALESLPDTLSLVIYAAYDKLEPVRVYTDIMDSINPYWLEQGDAYRFEFVNTIRIRGQYSRMVLLFNGHVVQNVREQFYNPDTRLIEIDRSFFEDDPRWLQPPPDSLNIDAPSPVTIQNRPTFN